MRRYVRGCSGVAEEKEKTSARDARGCWASFVAVLEAVVDLMVVLMLAGVSPLPIVRC